LIRAPTTKSEFDRLCLSYKDSPRVNQPLRNFCGNNRPTIFPLSATCGCELPFNFNYVFQREWHPMEQAFSSPGSYVSGGNFGGEPSFFGVNRLPRPYHRVQSLDGLETFIDYLRGSKGPIRVLVI
jgi:hypothetical protein